MSSLDSVLYILLVSAFILGYVFIAIALLAQIIVGMFETIVLPEWFVKVVRFAGITGIIMVVSAVACCVFVASTIR